jgi:hypothetical protein
MKSVLLIIPYFGEFPSYFSLWEKSAGKNESIDFLIVTDNKQYVSKYSNITIKNINFDELREKIQSKFDFKITLNNAYKLCDYKPAYGLIFDNEINNYDYWGYCDIDLIFGNIRKFINNLMELDYDRIFEYGHFSIFKKGEKMTRAFMRENIYESLDYKNAFTTQIICAFDEFYGINKIFKHYDDILTKGNTVSADIDFTKYAFYHNYNNNVIKGYFKWSDGKITFFDKNAEKDERMYVHLQKRVMLPIDFDVDKEKSFWIVPNKFLSGEKEIDSNKVLRNLPYFAWYRKKLKGLKGSYQRKKYLRKCLDTLKVEIEK